LLRTDISVVDVPAEENYTLTHSSFRRCRRSIELIVFQVSMFSEGWLRHMSSSITTPTWYGVFVGFAVKPLIVFPKGMQAVFLFFMISGFSSS